MNDWIKVEKTTPDKPEIKKAARLCGVSPDRAFVGWFRLWSWFDGETATGAIRFLAPEDCDDKAGVPGIGAAFAAIGWLEFSNDECLIVGWDKHMSASAKKRADDAKRQNEYRQKTGKDTGFRPWKR